MDVIGRLDKARRRTNVLEHPFYERWSAGELSARELAVYAGEYRHAVVALASSSALLVDAARPEHRAGLQRHAEEEAAHVGLWDRFARATSDAASACRGDAVGGEEAQSAMMAEGTPRAGANGANGANGAAGANGAKAANGAEERGERSRPLAQTAACAAAWSAGEDALERLAVLYAIESSQPEIARTKLDGLVEHYGYAPEGPAVEYFRLHEQLDVEHAQQAVELIETLLDGRPDGAAAARRMLGRARAALRGNWLLLDGVEGCTRA